MLSSCWRPCRDLAADSPREIKRLINNHRLMRVFMDVEEKLLDMDADKVVLWAFLCWKYGIDMHKIMPSTEVRCSCDAPCVLHTLAGNDERAWLLVCCGLRSYVAFARRSV